MNEIQGKIQSRNNLFRQIREFFHHRNVLEVDTPLLRDFSVTDPYMSALSVLSPSGKQQGYLQTSPEYAMKKLLCAGSGDIYQLSKMFRADERGNQHAVEFTMLEWYRLGFDHFQLMQEVCDFIQEILGKKESVIVSYRDLFIAVLAIDPFDISLTNLSKKARSILGELPDNLLFDNYLTLLFSEKIEASFSPHVLTLVHGYPESQASLAKTRTENNRITADRFEVYLGGLELANGFNELMDADLQKRRFEEDNLIRSKLGVQPIAIDAGFLRSLKDGLPDCAGVALGVDRLLMLVNQVDDINQVIF